MMKKTSRQARRERREAERKEKKQLFIQNRARQQAEEQRLQTDAALDPAMLLDACEEQPEDDDLSPELIAEARAIRNQIHHEAGLRPFTSRNFNANPQQNLHRQGAVSPAQLAANRTNAQHSTGPRTEAGRAISCLNNFRHGLAGNFTVLDWEDQEEYDTLLAALKADHKPSNSTEILLVEKMAQHYWLGQRALTLQNTCFNDEGVNEKQLALFLRYQTTHDRAFHKNLEQLLKLRAEKRKAEIGFESLKLKQAEQNRRDGIEKRKQEQHKWDILLAQAKVDHQNLLNDDLDFTATMKKAA